MLPSEPARPGVTSGGLLPVLLLSCLADLTCKRVCAGFWEARGETSIRCSASHRCSAMGLKTLIPSKLPPGVIKRNRKNVGMAVFPPGLRSGIRPLTVASVLQREAETTPCLGPFWDELLHRELLPPFEQSLAPVDAESWPGTVPALRKPLMETKDFPAC